MQKAQKTASTSVSTRKMQSQAAQKIVIAATTTGKTVKASFAAGVFILSATRDRKVSPRLDAVI
jgi:hypothetical protein